MLRAPGRRAAMEATGDDSSSEGEEQGVASNTHGRRTRRVEHLAAGPLVRKRRFRRLARFRRRRTRR
ncbi:unnamed protein product [Urochloa humidicola]